MRVIIFFFFLQNKNITNSVSSVAQTDYYRICIYTFYASFNIGHIFRNTTLNKNNIDHC